MPYKIKFNEEKNQVLKAERGLNFSDIAKLIAAEKFLDDIAHFDPQRDHQRLFLVEVEGYVFIVPYVINHQKSEIFLKTIYPSRKYTKLYRKDHKNE